MVSWKRIAETVAGVSGIAIIVAVVAIGTQTTIILPYGLTPYVVVAIGLLSYPAVDRILDAIGDRESAPVLVLEPLKLTSETLFNQIQFINVIWASAEGLTSPATILEYPRNAETEKQIGNRIQQNELTARFGIIRFHNRGGDAIGCRVGLRYESEIAYSDKKIWIDAGCLSWVSQSKRSSLPQMGRLDVFQMNRLLINPVEDIYRSQEKELQVCFAVKGGNAIILCSDWSRPNFMAYPTKLRLELTITAQKYPVTTRLFDLSVNDDSVILNEVKQSKQDRQVRT